jgi:lysine 2,3-aminomutase
LNKPLSDLDRVAARYAVAITPAMAELIDPADPADPIARQFLPSAAELLETAEERDDPIGDAAHRPLEGIVHRYPDRVLLTPIHVCAVYCRFCFRREVVGPEGHRPLSPEALKAALDYIRARPEIWEVILTGGDPLLLSPRRLRDLMGSLREIKHVKVVRLHTRIPAVDPERIAPDLVAALKSAGKAVFVVLHANHPRELTIEARAACARLVDAGIPMLSQSVLLRGVNDDPATLEALMRAFVETRIKPYYLHHPDLARGTSHFRLRLEDGQALIREMRGRVSGLCQPAYMLDIPGGHGKVPVGPAYLDASGPDGCVVEDYRGTRHHYPPDPEGAREP